LFGDGVTFPGTFEVGSSFISGRISFTGQTRDLGLVQIGAAGQVDVSGDYALSSGGRFTTSINNVQAPAAVGLFNITGTAALAGTLRVFFNTQTAPALGTQFVVMNYGAHTGTFTSIEVNGLPPDLTLVPGYNAGNLVLTVSGTGLN
jgi:hypothetical protein